MRIIGYVSLIVFAAVSICVAATQPHWTSDSNPFLRNFVNHEFLNLLGVILAITLASVVNVHFEFNKIEERFQQAGALQTSRANLRKNTNFLIGLFLVAVLLVVVKPLVTAGDTGEALVNSGALFILLWHVLILVSLTRLAFAIPPDIRPAASESSEAHTGEPPKPQRRRGTATGKQP